mgnify:FL=1|tara:strand:+ start:1716 stop:1946 length:231 start_codon:yes stop_codon:yes gene_type:complete
MIAVGDYVIIETEENTTESGIKIKHDNIGLVVSNRKEPDMNGCKVIYDDSHIYKRYGKYLFVPFQNIFAIVVGDEE